MLGSWVSGSGLLGRGLLGTGFVGRGRVGVVTSTPPTLRELAVAAPITASVLPKAMMKMNLFAIPWPVHARPEGLLRPSRATNAP
jgi:hypothetical protein